MEPVESLFATFAQRGDVEALAEVFDRTAPALLRLAMHLCRGADEAEDLLQATFVVAIGTARRFDTQRPLLAWLGGILHKQHRARWRRRLRRAGERLPDAAASPLPGPPQLAQQGELRDAIAAALPRLDALHREPLRLSLLDGLSPAEIALRLGRSPGAVRVQVHRGLQRLRRLLPPGIALGVAGGGRGLAAVRAEVLGHATASAAALAAASVVAGGVAMKKIAVAAAAALVALLVWVAVPREGAAPPAAGAVPRVDVAAGALASTDGDGSERTTQPIGSEAPAAPERQPPGDLLVRALDGDGLPVADVEVTVEERAGYLQPLHRGHTGADGCWRVHGIPAGPVAVAAAVGTAQHVAIRPGATAEVVLRVERGLRVLGRVVDAAGAPVAGARIVADERRWARAFVPVATSDAGGCFELANVPAHAAIGARAAGGLASEFVNGMPDADGVVRLQLVVQRGGADLGGRVVDRVGRAVAGAQVLAKASREDEPTHHADGSWRRQQADMAVAADGEGRFELLGLPAGRVQLEVLAPRHGCSEHAVELAAGIWQERTLVLDDRGELRGRITDAAGRAIDGAFAYLVAGRHWSWRGVAAFAAPDGSFCLPGLPPGEQEVGFHAPGHAPEQRTVRVAVDEPARCDVALAALPSVAGRVVDGAGNPVRCTVELEPEHGPNRYDAQQDTDAAGRFAIATPPGTTWRVSVRQLSPVSVPVDPLDGRCVPSGAQDVAIVLGDDDLATCWLQGRLVDADGNALRGAHLALGLPEYTAMAGAANVADGSFRLGPVPPRAYRLIATPRGTALPPATFGPFALAPRQTLQVGDLAVGAGGRVLLRWTRRDGIEVTDLQAALHPAATPADGSERVLAERLGVDARAEPGQLVAAGDYVLHAFGSGFTWIDDLPVTVRAGATTRIDLDLEPAARRPVRWPAAPPPQWRDVERATVTLWRDGRRVFEDTMQPRRESQQTRHLALAIGAYTLRLETDAGARFEGTFAVRELLDRGPPIDVAVQRVP